MDTGYDIDRGIYCDGETRPSNVVLMTGPEEMLKITRDAFYVRGVAVEQGPGEAAAVYEAFRQWMVWASLTHKR